MTLDAVCPAAADKAGEKSGLCYECREWRAFDGCIEHYGVCRQCREALRDQIWNRSSFVLEEIMTKYQDVPQILIDEAADILEDMATVMGAHAAPDPRDTED